MKGFRKNILLICVIYLTAAMVLTPDRCIAAAQSAILLCAKTVVPSLFPFFVCSNLLIRLGAARMLSRYLSPLMRPLFGIPGGGALTMVLGIVSGYPVGASCAATMYQSGTCTKPEAERMLAFCNNSGPMFVMGAIGVGVLGNPKLGLLLYGIHVLSALLTGWLFKNYGAAETSACLALPQKNSLSSGAAAVGESVADAVTAIAKVCGFVIVFAVFCAALPAYRGSSLVYALLEITGGIAAMQAEGWGNLLLPLISLFLAFSGISVLLQVTAIVSPAGLSVKPYLLGKLTQGILAFGLTALMLRFFPQTTEAFLSQPAMPAQVLNPKAFLLVTLFGTAWSFLALGLIVGMVWLHEKWQIQKNNKKQV